MDDYDCTGGCLHREDYEFYIRKRGGGSCSWFRWMSACGPGEGEWNPVLERCVGNASKDDGPPLMCGVGNPIHPGTGNKYQAETDYEGGGAFPLTFVRH